MLKKIFKKADYKQYIADDSHFSKTLTKNNLIAMGIGSIIGTGIFILPGIVAYSTSGPAITVSFILAAVVCVLAAMCFAELASTFPVAGSTYSYGSIIFGQFPGWIVGWALCLEYILGVAAVSSGFSAYFVSMFNNFGIHLPHGLTGPFIPSENLHQLTINHCLSVDLLPIAAWCPIISTYEYDCGIYQVGGHHCLYYHWFVLH